MTERFIVAEVSKNWKDGRETTPSGLIQYQFERVIAVNLERGYVLHSFQFHQVVTDPGCLNETIIAVFERQENAYEGATRTDVGHRSFVKGFRSAEAPTFPDTSGPGSGLS